MIIQIYNMMEAKKIRLKVSVAGLINVGKTSIIIREVNGQFQMFNRLTIGLDFIHKIYQVGPVTVKAQIWDQTGGESFASLKYTYMKRSNAICLCFSLDDRFSFQELPRYLQDFQKANLRCPVYLIGCKSDLEHAVSEKEIYEFADKKRLAYFKTSAKEGQGITEAFRIVIEETVGNILKDPELTAQLTLKQSPPSSPHYRSHQFCHV